VKRQVYKKYGGIFILVGLILWTTMTPSHFQKGGVDTEFYFAIAFFVTIISVLITLLFDKFNLPERILVSIPFAFISLFVTTFFFGPTIVEFFYSDKTWYIWETKYRIFINAVYYGLNVIILTLLANIYFKLRRLAKEGKKLKSAYG
jgi:hypothetical protein